MITSLQNFSMKKKCQKNQTRSQLLRNYLFLRRLWIIFSMDLSLTTRQDSAKQKTLSLIRSECLLCQALFRPMVNCLNITFNIIASHLILQSQTKKLITQASKILKKPRLLKNQLLERNYQI